MLSSYSCPILFSHYVPIVTDFILKLFKFYFSLGAFYGPEKDHVVLWGRMSAPTWVLAALLQQTLALVPPEWFWLHFFLPQCLAFCRVLNLCPCDLYLKMQHSYSICVAVLNLSDKVTNKWMPFTGSNPWNFQTLVAKIKVTCDLSYYSVLEWHLALITLHGQSLLLASHSCLCPSLPVDPEGPRFPTYKWAPPWTLPLTPWTQWTNRPRLVLPTWRGPTWPGLLHLWG